MLDTNTGTFTAGEDLAIFRRIKINSDREAVYADAADVADGITLAAVDSGDPVTVKLRNASGSIQAEASEAITCGASIYGAADGKIAASGTIVEGKAIEAATASGDVIEAVLANPGEVTAAAEVAALTEDSGAIGGTNDGDIPDLSAADAATNAAAIRELAAKVNAVIAALQAAGLMASS